MMLNGFHIEDHGTLVGFRPVTDRARQWWDDNVAAEGYLWLGPVCYVDHRCAQTLIDAIQGEA